MGTIGILVVTVHSVFNTDTRYGRGYDALAYAATNNKLSLSWPNHLSRDPLLIYCSLFSQNSKLSHRFLFMLVSRCV
ncbi:hypothetical protein Zmor_024333 [Zophobas morio]|uniref:Uncharacterized protein n=1 Tax=Zophobas morio TaxID=2755281 RepID=A0AA38M7M0_9CUCU|nr:hypothetical protein Zmor_024333 [Zophobas morio]